MFLHLASDGSTADLVSFRLVASAATRLLEAQSATEAARCVFEHAAQAASIDAYFSYLIAGNGSTLHLDSYAGIGAAAAAAVSDLPVGQAICGTVAAERSALVVERVQESLDPRTHLIRHLGLTAYVCHPLIGRDGLVGTLSFGSRTVTTFGGGELEMMATLVNLAALVIERAIAQERQGRADAELRATRALQTHMFDSSPSSIFARDLEGRLLLVNETLAMTLGRSKEDALGRSYDELYEPDVAQAIRAGEARVLSEGVAQTFEETLRKEGVPRTFITTKFPVRDAQGRIYGVGGVVTDITDRKRAEEALRESDQRFRTMADNIAQLAWMADETGAIVWYNQRWFDYTGTTFQDVAGWGWQQVHHPDHVDRVVEKVRHCFASGQVWEDSFPLRGRDGRYRWFLSRAVPIRNEEGRVARWFGTNTDITELREAEDALRAADRLKDEFLALLAHELRNPLAPIRFAVNLLGQDSLDESTKNRTRAIIDRQVTHLVRLVDDLLDVSRITRNKIQLRRERTEIGHLMRAALEASGPAINAARHTVTLQEAPQPLWAEADPTRLQQVFTNLLNNAAKFTPAGGEICFSAAADGHQAVVTVRDSGIGMPASMLPHVFDMFYQGRDSAEGATAGLGIGLTLVKRLVDMHGGSVHLASPGPGQGSTVSVRLPLAGAVGANLVAMQNAERGRPPLRPLRVLVVDDNADSADMLALLVSTMGHEARKVTDAHAALALAGTFRPDVALLDIGMPGMSGYELAERIRVQASPVPLLVAITGWGQEEDRRRARDAGFDRHLTKPADPAVIREVLSTAAGQLPTRQLPTPNH